MKHNKICISKIPVFILTLVLLLGAIFVLGIQVSYQKNSINSQATINCRAYNKKQCPINGGCQLVNERCITNTSYGLQSDTMNNCVADRIVQVMYYGQGERYTAARVTTGKEGALRILSGGLNPPNSESLCVVEFVTCTGKRVPGDTCKTAVTAPAPVAPTTVPIQLPNKTCQTVCQELGHHWCNVSMGGGSQFYGCKNNEESDGYYLSHKYNIYGLSETHGGPDITPFITETDPRYYKNSNNLHNCISAESKSILYNSEIQMCCQFGCVDPISAMPECHGDKAKWYTNYDACTAKNDNWDQCKRCKSGSTSYFLGEL